MRLEGSLDAFSLPDIFQLLSFTKKTGGLHLRRDSQHGIVYVTTGSLTGGCSEVKRQGLARRIVGAGTVGDDELNAAVEVAANSSDVGVARALQKAGCVDEGALHEAAVEHVIDTVFDLMRWPDGDFAFVVDENNPDDVGVSVSVEDAVAEARGRLESWTRVSTTVPSPDSVLAVALTPPDDPVLSREEWALLALVDGRRAVTEVVAATGRGEFAVVSTLASLVERGLLVVTGEGQPPAVLQLLRRLSALTAIEAGSSAGGQVAADAKAVQTPAANTPDDDEAATDDLAASVSDLSLADFATDVMDTPAQRDPAEVDEPAAPRAEAELDAEVVEEFPAEVIPPRAEPFLARRRPEHPDDDFTPVSAGRGGPIVGQVDGTAAVAAETMPAPGLIERDPSVNKSLLLRLIAGVRGL
ncbi:MAG: DUF4388 domain-containing protein [Actinomycetes bacterium]